MLMRLETAAGYAMYKVHPDGTGLRALTPFSAFRPRGMAWQSLAGDES